MRRFERGPCPDFLEANWHEWGQRYSTSKTQNPAYQFIWFVVPGKPGVNANHAILPFLASDTDKHCAYCDRYFPDYENEISIDHFQPKGMSAYYPIAYQWTNLYFCCPRCQRVKGEQYSDLLLRPDGEEYNFNRYFVYDDNTHQISANPQASIPEQERALETIRIFNLNGLATTRKLFKKIYGNDRNPIIEEYPFRFMFE